LARSSSRPSRLMSAQPIGPRLPLHTRLQACHARR
jgi:hypothetical protein